MWLIVPLLGGLATVMGSLVGRVLLALGISYVTFKGYDLAVGWLLDQVKASIGGMPAEIVSFLAFMWVDRAIGMVFAAYTVALAFKTAGGTGITKMVTKA